MQSFRKVLICLLLAAGATAASAEPPAAPEQPARADGKVSPLETVKSAPKGTLKNPYTDAAPALIEQGGALFAGYSCSACHGPTGGGGLCPSLTNEIWVYGGDDDTLFRLIAQGSDQMQKQGYSRTGHESIVASMPAFGGSIKSADDLWMMLAFIRAHYAGDPKLKYGAATSPP